MHVLLENLLASGRMFPPLLFVGPQYIDKKTEAFAFAGELLGSSVDRNLDFHYFDVKIQGTMEGVRELIHNVGLSPSAGAVRVFVLDNFDSVSNEAANALLKTLEEPPKASRIILIAHTRDLPDTVISRCLFVGFNAQADQVEVQNPVAQELVNAWKASLTERLLVINRFGQKESDELREIFLAAVFLAKKKLKVEPGLYVLLRKLLEALQQLTANIHKKLILQSILL